MEPYWCSNNSSSPEEDIGGYYNRVNTEAWAEAFFDRDGGRAYGSRQCRYQPSQRELFMQTVRKRFTRRRNTGGPDHDHANPWNEINFYVERPDGELAGTMWDNLLGLLYVRSAGNDEELRQIRRLALHWRELGVNVPLFSVDAESVYGDVSKWEPDQEVDLLGDDYGLEEIIIERPPSSPPSSPPS